MTMLLIACSEASDETNSDGSSGTGARAGNGGSGQLGSGGSARPASGGSANGAADSNGGSSGNGAAGTGAGAGASSGGAAGNDAGGSNAGTSSNGGSSAAGATSTGQEGCTELSVKLKTFQESEHSAAECTGIVGELISSFDIGINDPEKSRWIFKLKTDMPMGKTGKFGAQVWVDSIDTFDGPWESITNQCSLDASVNQKFSATAVIKVKVSCNPKQIANPFFGEDKLTLENFEFAGEFPIEQ